MCQVILQMLAQLFRHLFYPRSQHKDAGEKSDLEAKIKNLQNDNAKLQRELDYSKSKEIEFQKVLLNYDNITKELMAEKNSAIEAANTIKSHLGVLETAFQKLLNQFENAKSAIKDFQENEIVLKTRIQNCEKIIREADGRRTTTISPRDELTSKMKPKSSKLSNKKQRLITTI